MINLNSIDLFVNYCAVDYYNCWTIQFVYLFSNYFEFVKFLFGNFLNSLDFDRPFFGLSSSFQSGSYSWISTVFPV